MYFTLLLPCLVAQKFKEIDTDNSGFIDAEEIEAFSAQEKTLAEAQLAKMKADTRHDITQTSFGPSFSWTLGLGFADPLGDDDEDTDGANADADDASSVRSSNSGGSIGRHGEEMQVGGWQFWLYGGGAQRDHHHSLVHSDSHNHHGDLMPADLRAELRNISADEIDCPLEERDECDEKDEAGYRSRQHSDSYSIRGDDNV